MIKINPQLKGKEKEQIYICKENFPHLFEYDEIHNNFWQVLTFWCDFDEENNFIIETTEDKNQIKDKIKKILEKQNFFCDIILEQTKQKKEAIKQLLEEV